MIVAVAVASAIIFLLNKSIKIKVVEKSIKSS